MGAQWFEMTKHPNILTVIDQWCHRGPQREPHLEEHLKGCGTFELNGLGVKPSVSGGKLSFVGAASSQGRVWGMEPASQVIGMIIMDY